VWGFFYGMKFDVMSLMNFKNTYIILLLFITLVLGCKSTRSINFQSEIPLQIDSPYFQTWVAGVQGGGSGIDVFLPVKDLNSIIPDSIHFRGQRVQTVYKNSMIVGHFSTPQNQRQDVILSNEPLAEANNQLLPKEDHSAFELEPNTCVLSYILENKRYYYKITDLTQRPSIPYPTTPPSPPH
jgi:hypothetical protein